ncbi:LOW QUALITY PROTEIN: protein HIRA-like [Liolophura sinensis]|uniref:LOW QUALITY PROTEIN: protein HIRA-like n=1 Tax=Liolophura sinensis TaxID=3198878 RepID=UPI003158EAA1
MRLLKPAWVAHDGMPIFSVDIHPDGSRFATGGQGEDGGTGKVMVWNMAPVRDEKCEKDEKIPKLLCQMDNHLACVNCVRWSHNGKYLASGSDDNIVMIWQLVRYGGPSSVFGSSGKVVNHEHWRCASTLRGHSGDVLDLAWSAHDAWLATCSVDNTVVVWNALKFPEQITVLRGHSGLVKGVTWDPVGKYLASQSDDKSVRVWRTLDWQQELVITEPFKECGGTTHVLRLNWSPDGHYIVSAHAMNNSGPTAQIIEREGWRTAMDFVGHRKAVTVVRFNPCILSKKVKKDTPKPQQYSCCAIGSRDRSLSVWLTALKRPLVVTHDLFSSSIMDISWSQSGMELICCSWDGTVAFIDFCRDEIGVPLSRQEVISLHERVYGNSLAANSYNPANQVVESAALLKLQQQEQERRAANQAALQQTPTASLTNGESPMKPTDKQIETTTPDGRRRITPIFLAPQPDFGTTIQFATTSEPSKIIVEKQNRVTQPGLNISGNSLSTSPKSLPGNQSQPGTQGPSGVDKESHSQPAMLSQPSSPTPSAPIQVQPMTPLASKKDDEKRISPKERVGDKSADDDGQGRGSVLKLKKKHDPDRPKKRFKKGKELGRNRHYLDTSTPGDGSREVDRNRLYQDTSIPVHLQECGTRDWREVCTTWTYQLCLMCIVVIFLQVTTEKESVRVVYTSPDPQLPVASIDKRLTYEIASADSSEVGGLVLEVENGIQSGAATLHKVSFMQDGTTLWEHVFSHKILTVAASRHIVCAACDDNTVSVFSAGGKKLFPSLVLNSKTSFLDCKDFHVMAVTSKGSVNVWNMKGPKSVIKNESLSPLLSGSSTSVSKAYLTHEGVPVLVLSDDKSYTMNPEFGCWVVVSQRQDLLYQCSDHYSSQPLQQVKGPLSSLQSAQHRFGGQARAIYRTSPPLQQASTVSYLENQLAVCSTLKSASEYKFWLSTYIRFLAQEGLEGKLREVCDDLLGPVFKSSSKPAWDANILSLSKRELLQELLPLVATNLQLQRIYTEYQEQLDTVKL